MIGKIMLAEDDADDYNMFKETIEELFPGIELKRAVDGLECMLLLKQADLPDLIFLNLNIPIINGIECLKLIKSKHCLQQIPLVVYSTSHYIRDIDNAYRNSANYYIIKPDSKMLLKHALQKLFEELKTSNLQPNKQQFVIGIKEIVEV